MGMTVPTKLTVFGVDCCTDEFLPHPGCCALSLSCHQILFAESADTNTTTTTSSSSSSNTHLLTISKGGGNSSSSVCLFVHVSADINDDSHIIVPEWALSVLKVTHGTMSVLVEPVFPVIEDTDNITEVRFVFKAYQSYRHWDNVATSTPFSIPGSWSCGWPELSKQVVQKMLPVLLHSRRFLIDRSLLVVDILDVGMVSTLKTTVYRFTTNQSILSRCSSFLTAYIFQMFHVQFIGNNNEDMSVRRIIQIAPLLSKKLTVVIPNTEMKVNDVIVDNSPEYQPSYYCLHGFFSTIYRRITSICNAAVLRRPNSSEDSWKGVRSMLISASEGAGKSSLLLEIQKGLQAAVKIAGQEESPGVQIVCLSGKGIELRYDRSVPLLSNTNQEDTKPSSPFQSTSARRRMKIRENLQILMQLLQPQEVQNGGYPTSISTTTASTTTPLRVIVVIDDLDQILAANGGTSLEDEAAGDAARRGTVCLRAAYHLRQLLHDLSIQQSHDISSCTNENDQIVVIGATRMAINLLPRSHQGAPEFELTLNLTRPARFDREQLIFNMLEGMQTQWVLEELEDDTSDGGHISVLKPEKSSNMRIWASRMAGLTAGYLPGDLGQVMRRAINTYLGQMSMANVSETTTTSKNTAEKLQTKPCLSWRSMLAVIASQPPRQLQQLSSIVAGVGGSDGARTNLTWDDFAGYDDVKQSLQRLINSSKISHTRLKSSQQTVCDQHDEKNSSHSTTAIDSNQLTLRGYLKITTSSMRGIVFHGQPGCGKSFLARIVAAEVSRMIVYVAMFIYLLY